MTRRIILLAFVALLAFPATLFARDAKQDKRINALLTNVENLQGATFIRNGKSYDPKTAASHLRMKLGKAGDRVKTAEDFIKGIATKSYFTGRLYQIKLKDGSKVESGKYLSKQLAAIDAAAK